MSDRQSNVSRRQGQIDTQTDSKTQSAVPQSHTTVHTSNVLTSAMAVSDQRVDAEHVVTEDQLPQMPVGHTGHIGRVLLQDTIHMPGVNIEHPGHVSPLGTTHVSVPHIQYPVHVTPQGTA